MATQTETSLVATAGEQFVIELESNPTTGYEWQPDYPEDRLRLVRHERPQLQRRATAGQLRVGEGGIDRFVFEALSPGEVSIRMDLKRAWEPMRIDQRTFRVTVRR